MRRALLVLSILFLAAGAAVAQPTTYSYVGDPYTAATAPYAVGGQVTGSVTFASPLPAFLPLTDMSAALSSLAFSDGVETRTLASSFVCSFEVATDGIGNITEWQISLRRSPYNPGDPHHSIDSSGSPGITQGADFAGTGTAPAGPCDPMVLSSSGSTGSQGFWSSGSPQPSNPTTYHYTGDPYSSATGPYTALGGQVTGSVTFANPLPAFLPMTDVSAAITSLSFSDFVETRTLGDSFVCTFEVATDGLGNITQWQISLRRFPYNPGDPHHSIESTGSPGITGGADVAGTGTAPAAPCGPMVLTTSGSTSGQGTWTDSNLPPSDPTTYNYLGDPYTVATAPYALGGQVTGSVTFANPLPPFLPLTDVRPALTALTFNDGVETRTLANSFICGFEVATDGAGNITRWQILLRRSPYNPGDPHHSIESTGTPGITGGSDLAGTGTAPASPCDPMALTSSGSSSSQGTWTDDNPLASLSTTYNYLGDPFTVATPPYVLGGRVTGSVTFDNPLPAFLPLTDVTPWLESLTFTDGVETRTLPTSFICRFEVATDGAGNITRWEILLRAFPYNPGDPHHSIESTGSPGVPEGGDLAGTGLAPAAPCGVMVLSSSGSTGSQGTWISQTSVLDIPVLDPRGVTILALLLALGGLAFLQRSSWREKKNVVGH